MRSYHLNHCCWTEHTAKGYLIAPYCTFTLQQTTALKKLWQQPSFQAALQPDLLASYEKESVCGGKGTFLFQMFFPRAFFESFPKVFCTAPLKSESWRIAVLFQISIVVIWKISAITIIPILLWSSRNQQPRRVRFHVRRIESGRIESNQVQIGWNMINSGWYNILIVPVLAVNK